MSSGFDYKTEAVQGKFLLKDEIAQRKRIVKENNEKANLNTIKHLIKNEVNLVAHVTELPFTDSCHYCYREN